MVLPTLLYVCKTWADYQHHAKRLNHFHLSCLTKKILEIRWQEKIPDTEVLKKDAKRTYSLKDGLALFKIQECLMSDYQRTFLWRSSGRKRIIGCQKKRDKSTNKVFLESFSIPTVSWKQARQKMSRPV